MPSHSHAATHRLVPVRTPRDAHPAARRRAPRGRCSSGTASPCAARREIAEFDLARRQRPRVIGPRAVPGGWRNSCGRGGPVAAFDSVRRGCPSACNVDRAAAGRRRERRRIADREPRGGGRAAEGWFSISDSSPREFAKPRGRPIERSREQGETRQRVASWEQTDFRHSTAAGPPARGAAASRKAAAVFASPVDLS